MRAASPLAIGVTAAGLLAALLLVVADFFPIVSVDVASGSCAVLADPELRDGCVQTGFERHGPAMTLLGLSAAAMAWGAGVGGSRPAAAALAALGLVAVGIALVVDLPVTDDTGAIGPFYDGARAARESGLTIELAGGALALAAGAVRLLARERE